MYVCIYIYPFHHNPSNPFPKLTVRIPDVASDKSARSNRKPQMMRLRIHIYLSHVFFFLKSILLAPIDNSYMMLVEARTAVFCCIRPKSPVRVGELVLYIYIHKNKYTYVEC